MENLYVLITTITTSILLMTLCTDNIIFLLSTVIIYVTSALWGIKIFILIKETLKNLQIITTKPTSNLKDKNSCWVCNDNACKRHKLSQDLRRAKVPKDFDQALEQLLEGLLQTYVCTWYSNLSTNDAFIHQLRFAIATAARNITCRLLHTNIPVIIFNDLIPMILHHAQDWKSLKDSQITRDNIKKHLNNKIHPAARSRQSEISYLKGLMNTLMPHILPTIHVSTNNKVILREVFANWILLPAMDALADPDNINTLIIIATNQAGFLTHCTEDYTIPMLQNWMTLPMNENIIKTLKPSLDTILNDPQLLYLFMQHIKETGPMNLLQFCLDIDDLSKRMLNPEMTPELEQNFYTDIKNMYLVYLDPKSPEFLHLPLHISIEMHRRVEVQHLVELTWNDPLETNIKILLTLFISVLKGGVEKIQELRTSKPIYQAHQEAYALLEATCLPTFHHSYQLYNLMCGHATSEIRPKSYHTNPVMGSSNVGVRFGSQLGKISGVLKTSTIDGSLFQTETIYRAEEVDCSTTHYHEINCLNLEDKSPKDFTTWRVTIPDIDTAETQPLYIIAVYNITEDKSWTVLRRDQDFHTFRTKLIEFHGEKILSDAPLPSRKNQSSHLIIKQQYQEFLQNLLSKPMLKSSELLYTFLTARNLKPYYATQYGAPDIGIIYQSVTHKLRKERGQHLDKFMTTFLNSTCTKYEYADVGIEPMAEDNSIKNSQFDRIFNPEVFGNNLDLQDNIEQSLDDGSIKKHVKGACFCIAEAVESLLTVPSILSRFFWIFAHLLHDKLDPTINLKMYNVLWRLLCGGRAAIVVKMLHERILGPRTVDETESLNPDIERLNSYSKAKQGLHNLFPWWLIGLHLPCNQLSDSLLDSLQYPPLNKHLGYWLLDRLLIDLFPELTT